MTKNDELPKLNILSLHGESGSGKDTLAQFWVEKYQAIRFSIGDWIREDVDAVYRKPRPTPEGEREPGYHEGLSYKDMMMVVGSSFSMHNPTRYLDQLLSQLAQTHRYQSRFSPDDFVPGSPGGRMVVLTDIRRPIELDTIARLNYVNLYCIRLHRVGGVTKKMKLDDLLDQPTQPWFGKIHDVINDDLGQTVQEIKLKILSNLPMKLS